MMKSINLLVLINKKYVKKTLCVFFVLDLYVILYMVNNMNGNYDNSFNDSTSNFIGKMFRFLFGGGVFVLFSIIFICVGGSLFIKECLVAKDYVKTIGIFEDYTSCSDGVCGSRYSYVVDGETYYVSSDLNSNYFPEKDNVYYNPGNPSESMMFSNWHVLFIAGVVMLGGRELFKRKIKSYLNSSNKNGPINV